MFNHTATGHWLVWNVPVGDGKAQSKHSRFPPSRLGFDSPRRLISGQQNNEGMRSIFNGAQIKSGKPPVLEISLALRLGHSSITLF